eukprot:gnl/TRDRNA2_/TRDRNA2_93766_c0_seq1.p1 gnl/TRDRNA2_/TRDRNA2_93766_c0~~gnl/TRDRNA2_/TRDRNA2_93766_c0_seq1.p1  ORF type:complete len:228 (-),score=55.11 gnl/TRDRNA2_/TRDRNA2_93766_c0_seq1:164-847(-)
MLSNISSFLALDSEFPQLLCTLLLGWFIYPYFVWLIRPQHSGQLPDKKGSLTANDADDDCDDVESIAEVETITELDSLDDDSEYEDDSCDDSDASDDSTDWEEREERMKVEDAAASAARQILARRIERKLRPPRPHCPPPPPPPEDHWPPPPMEAPPPPPNDEETKEVLFCSLDEASTASELPRESCDTVGLKLLENYGLFGAQPGWWSESFSEETAACGSVPEGSD